MDRFLESTVLKWLNARSMPKFDWKIDFQHFDNIQDGISLTKKYIYYNLKFRTRSFR